MGTVRINGNDFNIFGDETEARTYLGARFNGSDFLACDEDRQRVLLNTASQEIALFLECADAKLDVTADTNDQPEQVKNAVYELALIFAGPEGSEILAQNNTGSNIRRARAGSAEVEFFSNVRSGSRFPDPVQRLLNAYGLEAGLSFAGVKSGSAFSPASLVQGECNESTFANRNRYGKNEGF